ncbi:hypothetical protein BJF83_10235 [Nocardiopsis sp. CNR-923]|nr:hypothetical protein BJF83_10235 [Nocardiopsis sp. CNR-923]
MRARGGAEPAAASHQPSAVAHQLAVAYLVDLAPGLGAARRLLLLLGAAQSATGKAVRSVDPGCSTFAVLDEDLRDAAATEGFAPLPERWRRAG